VTAPGTVVEVDQRSDPVLLDRASTLAAQLYATPLVQSRCPTRLIEEGRTSRMAVEDRGGLGWDVAVGGSVAAAVGACGGAAVVAASVAPVRAASEVVPQAANALASRSALSNTTAQRTMNRRKVTGHTADLLIGIGARRVTKAFAGALRGGCPVRVNGR